MSAIRAFTIGIIAAAALVAGSAAASADAGWGNAVTSTGQTQQ